MAGLLQRLWKSSLIVCFLQEYLPVFMGGGLGKTDCDVLGGKAVRAGNVLATALLLKRTGTLGTRYR